MNLSNSIGLTDVFVVLDSIHKLCKDNKCKVIFDENNYYVWYPVSMDIVETGRVNRGLVAGAAIS